MTTQVNSTVLGTLGNLTVTNDVRIGGNTLFTNGGYKTLAIGSASGGGFLQFLTNGSVGPYIYNTSQNLILWTDGGTPKITLNNAVNKSVEIVSANVDIVSGNVRVSGNLTVAGGISFGETGTAYGTSGQILKSNGNSPPSWNSLASFTEFDKSLATDGYQKLPGGLIIQWGTTGVIAGPGTATITFPIVFTTSCFNVQITIKDESGDTSSTGIVAARSVTTTGFILRNGDDPNMIFNWLAIGY
jgi:hypothetical protein